MPSLRELLSDPDFQGLSAPEQSQIRREYFEKNIRPSAEFKALDTGQKTQIYDETIGPNPYAISPTADPFRGLSKAETIRAPVGESYLTSGGRVAARMAGGSLGAFGGAAVGNLPGAVGGAIAGDIAAKELYNRYVAGVPDVRTPEQKVSETLTEGLTTGAFQAAGPAITRGITAGGKAMIRGGRAATRRLGQAIEEFGTFGDVPSAAVGTGRTALEALESTLGRFPGSRGPIIRAAKRTADRIATRVNQLTGSLSETTEPTIAGTTIQKGIQGFTNRFKETSRALYGRVNGLIPQTRQVTPQKTISTVNDILEDIPDPAFKGWLNNQVVSDLQGRLGQAAESGGVSFGTLQRLRSKIGSQLTNFDLVSDIPRAQMKRIYGALSDDILAAAEKESPAALRAAKRANQYYKAGITRIDDFLEKLGGKNIPEQVFTALERGGKDGATLLTRVRRSLKSEEWDVVAGTVLKRLGKSKPSIGTAEEAIDTAGDVFDPMTFLTNWNRLDSAAKDVLFGGPGKQELKQGLNSLVKGISRIRETSKAFANPSGTAGAGAGIMTAAGVGAGGAMALYGSPEFLGGLALGSVGANGLARLMTSPRFVKWLAASTRINPNGFGAHLGRLGAIAVNEDPETRDAIRSYLSFYARDERGVSPEELSMRPGGL